jgi:hypothetical protein
MRVLEQSQQILVIAAILFRRQIFYEIAYLGIYTVADSIAPVRFGPGGRWRGGLRPGGDR